MMPLFPEWIFELAFMTQTTALLYGREFQLPNSFNTLKNSLGKEIISLLVRVGRAAACSGGL
jgi:hypothetical protein